MTHRILLVEDDPVSRDVLAALLSTRGYAVDTADDGFGALRMAQDETYDLVFVDYHLPEMDGYALARLMRTLSEKTNPDLKMVAITADRFGLAARRGVDGIFDRVLAKPIEPETLFAFVDAFLAERPTASALDSFLADPTPHDAQTAAQVLWRVRGIDVLPAGAVFPAPSEIERARLESCFRLVEPQAADCLLLLHASGRSEVEAWRAAGHAYLQPLFALEPSEATDADLLFRVGDGESWSAAAACLTQFRDRRRLLKAESLTAKAFEVRLAAYLFVSDRPVLLRRDQFGRTSVPYAGGFATAAVIEAIKGLAGEGLVAAKVGAPTEADVRELYVSLTPKGLGMVAEGRVAATLSAG